MNDTEYSIREANEKDLAFLREMLYEAVFWNPENERIPLDEIMAVPEIGHLLEDWKKRQGDFAFIAQDRHGKPVAAVWYRYYSAEFPSYGFVDESTPELGIAVSAKYRKQGLGSQLMTEILSYARKSGIRQVSLSVDPHNPARNMYQKMGFEKHSESGTSWTMIIKFY